MPLSVSDAGFGLDRGSMEPNIAAQSSTDVTLASTNMGSEPHGLHDRLHSEDLCQPLALFF